MLFYLVIASLVAPGYVLSIGIGLMFQLLGLDTNWYTSALGAQLSWTLPFGLLIMFAIFGRFSRSYEEVARDLGANQAQTMWLVVQSDPARTVYSAPRGAYVARFVGEQNVLSGRLESVSDGMATLRADSGRPFLLRVGGKVHPAGRRLQFSVRRDHARLAKPTDASVPPFNAVVGVVRAVEYQGTFVKVTVRPDAAGDKGDLFVAYVEGGDYFAAPIGIAERVCAEWDLDEMHALAAE